MSSEQLGGEEIDAKVAIRISNLSKVYEIYDTPRQRLLQFILPRLRRWIGLSPKRYFREFHALRDMSLELARGETVGVIGRNGSGKSTLLQLVCGTLTPSSGEVRVRGRVAALLELGSGFNPEFTGRENVYLNASVLGLSNQEIDDRFASIEAFADIAEFIDQPVKAYSSGMVVRLAFAVIAHVDADVLVIDEALSVGDAVFSQKCMRFLRGFMKNGTVLFVSHDGASVLNLCERAVWLHEGRVVRVGPAKAVVEDYMQFTQQQILGDNLRMNAVGAQGDEGWVPPTPTTEVDSGTKIEWFDRVQESNGWETGHAWIRTVRLVDLQGNELHAFLGGERVRLEIWAEVARELFSPILGWLMKDRLGQVLFGGHTAMDGPFAVVVAPGEQVRARFDFCMPLLPNGDYSMTVSIAEGEPANAVQHHWLHEAIVFRVASTRMRYGLVGIPFEQVEIDLVRDVSR